MEPLISTQNDYFPENISEILSRAPKLIDKDQVFLLSSSGHSAISAYNVNQESFLAYPVIFRVWGGLEEGNITEQPIKILNLSQNKTEASFQVAEPCSSPYVTSLIVYPKTNPRFICCGDNAGSVKFFDLMDKGFKLISSFNVNKDRFMKDWSISTMEIFDDKFNNVVAKGTEDKTCLVLYVSLENPLLICNLKGEKIGEIPAEPKGICHKLNYFYDESQAKTVFFCGWSGCAVRKYDFGSKSYTLKYESTFNEISALEFLEKGPGQRYVLYGHTKSWDLTVADTEKENIIKVIKMEHDGMDLYLMDILVWNSLNVIAATWKVSGEQQILLINTDTWEIKMVSSPPDTYSTNNLVKYRNEKGKACLITVQDNKSIYLFE